jgi:hypothetical protein
MFGGPWRVIDANSLMRRLSPGEIMQHKSGVLVLSCPACGVLQFAACTVEGDPPSISGTVRCAAAQCPGRRCACRWTIIAGRTVAEDAPGISRQ